MPTKAGGKGDRRIKAAENRLPAPVIGMMSAATTLMRLICGAARKAKSRRLRHAGPCQADASNSAAKRAVAVSSRVSVRMD
jgi:hypothetical protein